MMPNITLTFSGETSSDIQEAMRAFLADSTSQAGPQGGEGASGSTTSKEKSKEKSKAAPKKKATGKSKAPYAVSTFQGGKLTVETFEDVDEAAGVLADALRGCETRDEYTALTEENVPLAHRLTREKATDALDEVKNAVDEALANTEEPESEDADDLLGDGGDDPKITMESVRDIYTRVINELGIPVARSILDKLDLGEGVKIKEIPEEHWPAAYAAAVKALK